MSFGGAVIQSSELFYPGGGVASIPSAAGGGDYLFKSSQGFVQGLATQLSVFYCCTCSYHSAQAMVAGTISVLPLFLQLLICMLFTFALCYDLLGLGLFNIIYNCLCVAIIVNIFNSLFIEA